MKDKFWWNQLEINYFFLWSFWENWGEVYSLGQRDVHNRHINDHSHSCIRDQCWKSFPSPFFATAHVSQGGCGTQGPIGFGQQGPAPVVFRFHPSPTASASGRRGPSRKRRRSYGGRLGLFICSSVLQNVFPAIRKYLVKYHLYSFLHWYWFVFSCARPICANFTTYKCTASSCFLIIDVS